MRVPFHISDTGPREADAVSRVILGGRPAGGAVVEEYERAVAHDLGFEHAIAVASCTQGFACLWPALGIAPDDYALFPSFTFTGPAMSLLQHGAHVRFADSGSEHPNMTAESAHDAFWHRDPFAIVPTLFAGDPIEDALFDLARSRAGYLILDAAQAYGSRLTSKKGQKPDAAVISTYATKTVCTGHGGIVLTDDPALARELVRLRLHGIERREGTLCQPHEQLCYDVAAPGFKANMTDMAAAMGLVQLDRRHGMARRRRVTATSYNLALSDMGWRPPPRHPDGNDHLYTLKIDRGLRDDFVNHMANQGVGTSIHFRPLHMHSFWGMTFGEDPPPELPLAEAHYREIVSLPISSAMTKANVETVIEALSLWVAAWGDLCATS